MVALSEFHNEIRAAIESGELETARHLCRAVLAVRAENLETLLLLAEVDLEGGSPREAIEGFERVLEGDPEGYLACAGMGLAWEMVGDHAAGAHWLSRSLELNPASREVRSERDRLYEEAYPGRTFPCDSTEFLTARSLQGSGFLAEAVQTYRTALRQEPGRLEVKLGLAEGLWSTGHSAEAEQLCLEALAAAPRAVKAKALLACVAAERGDLHRGEALLEDVRAQDPGGRIAGHLIGRTPLAPLAIEGVDIDVAQLGEGAPDRMRAEAPRWAEWMRRALWQVLRVVLPRERDDDSAIELEMAIGPGSGVRGPGSGARSAESRVARALGDDGQETVDLSGQLPEAAVERVSTVERALVSEEVFRVPISEAAGSGQPAAGEAERDAAASLSSEGAEREGARPIVAGVAPSERAVELEAAPRAAEMGEKAGASRSPPTIWQASPGAAAKTGQPNGSGSQPSTVERTLVIVKPDGVQRGLVGAILGRLEGRGLKLRGLKFMSVSRKLAEQHYAVHRDKPFYEGLVKYITSGPVVAAVFEGMDAVAVVRTTVGATNPAAASPGTIRGDWAVEIGRNLVHASDSRETGEAEIALWFRAKELVRWRRVTEGWISEMAER